MKVTNEMIYAAIEQAVKDGILPKYENEEKYLHNYESVKRMLVKAIEAGLE